MRKRIKTRKFGRTSNQRKQLFRNLIRSLAMHGFVETSETKAKAVKPIAEKLVTKAKEQTLSARRAIVSETGEIATAEKLMELGKLFEKRKGGYLRIFKKSHQIGDDTTNVRLEWVEKLAKAEVILPQKNLTPAVEVKTKENKKELVKKKTEKPAQNKIPAKSKK